MKVFTTLCTLPLTLSLVAGTMVRSSSNARLWQVDLSPSEPVAWRWMDSSESARLVVTCHVERTVIGPATVLRQGGERYGSYALPVPADRNGVEYLYDLVLDICRGETVLASHFARVAVLPCVNGGSFSLKKAPPSGAWSSIPPGDVPLVPYDSAWTDSSAEDATATLVLTRQDGSEATMSLAGRAGFEPFDPQARMCGGGRFSLSLAFDGISAAAAELYSMNSTLLIFR